MARLVKICIVVSLLALSSSLVYAGNTGDFGELDFGMGDMDQYAGKQYQKLNILTVDTRDQEACKKIALTLYQKESISEDEFLSFCREDSKKPLVSVIVVDGRTTIGSNYSDLSKTDQAVAKQTRNFVVPVVGVMALLFALPSSVTNWEDFKASELGSNYVENVSTKPQRDEDEDWINYIGHPYAGAAYYVVARHSGYGRGKAFLYSAFMSTFFWEYGIESLAEPPSIQDLIVTPVFGAILGEAFIAGAERINENNGQVLGSKRLGNVALTLMDPAGAILDGVNGMFKKGVIKDSRLSMSGGLKDNSESEVTIHFDLFF